MFRARLMVFVCGMAAAVVSATPAPQDASRAFQIGPLEAPADRLTSLVVGPVTITAFNPVTITPLEDATEFYFTARNTGAAAVTLQFTSWSELQASKNISRTVLMKFFGFESQAQPVNVPLNAGETRTLGFFIGKDSPPETVAQYDLPFRVQVVETGQQGTMTITIVNDGRERDLFKLGTKSATITGRVTSSDGVPLAGALVTIALWNERIPSFRQTFDQPNEIRTDSNGRYSVHVFSIDEIKTIFGSRSIPYRTVDYFLTAEADGYSVNYRAAIAPATGQTVTVDATLQPAAQKASYTLVGELPTDGRQSYWWIKFAGSGDRVVSVQGQHPPELHLPGHIIAVDLTGKELWRVPTGDECWGLDVSPDGRVIAAACHDGFLYLVSDVGQLLYKLQAAPSGQASRETRFSPDGQHVLVEGGPGDFLVVNVQTGKVVWKSSSAALPAGDASIGAYRSRWSPDGKRLVASGPNGPIAMFTSDGQLLWRGHVGVGQLWLEIDSAYNVYAAGKDREVFSFDKDGKLRWNYAIAHTSNAATRGITADGTFMIAPTFNGLLQAFDSNGGVLWQHLMPTVAAVSPNGSPINQVLGPGHNALAMTPTGSLVAVGTRGYQVLVYDRNGTLLWKHTSSVRTDFKGGTPGPYVGANAVAISTDGKYIAAGYADSVIRIFAASGAPSAPTGLVASASGSSVTLAWSAPASAPAPDTYVIEAGSATGLADLASFSTGTAATTFSATGVASGTYYVRVRAGNAAGNSAPSNEATLVVGGGSCTAPGAPANLAIVSASSGNVVLTWTGASGSPTSYVVEAGSAPGGANLANSDLGTAATSLTASGVASGTYYVRVRGKNSCGVGASSNEVTLNVS